MYLSNLHISHKVHDFKFILYGVKFHQCALGSPASQKCSVDLTIIIPFKK